MGQGQGQDRGQDKDVVRTGGQGQDGDRNWTGAGIGQRQERGWGQDTEAKPPLAT